MLIKLRFILIYYFTNSGQNLSGFANPNERYTLLQELDMVKRASIIERGKLLNERNKLKEELKNLKVKMGVPMDKSGFLNDSLNLNTTPPNQSTGLIDSLERKEMEDFRKRSIIERGKLLEERNQLKEENERLKSQTARPYEPFAERIDIDARRKQVLQEVDILRQERERDRQWFKRRSVV